MATNNAININEGNLGQLLVSQGAATPQFSNAATGGGFTFTQPTAGSAVSLDVNQTDNTNTGSHSFFQAKTGGTSGGNPYITFALGAGIGYGLGIDNTDSIGSPLIISTGTSGPQGPQSGTKIWNMLPSGARTMPKQPCFGASVSTPQTNVTGDGTLYFIQFDNVQFDQSSSFSTPNFTVPVTGHYLVGFVLCLTGILVGHTSAFLSLSYNSGGAGQTGVLSFNPFACYDIINNQVIFSGSILAAASPATLSLQLTVSGSTKTVSVINPTNFSVLLAY